MKRIIIIAFVLVVCKGYAQQTYNYFDATAGVAKYQGSFSLAFVHNWQLGASRKFEVGVGGRFTSYIAANQYYVTAPAELTSESTSPFIIFKDNVTANMDTFLVKSPQINSLNLSIHLGYQLGKKISAGFNIDAIGLSFGGSRSGNYINGPVGKVTTATPTTFNLLLVSDNDRGSLNSEFYLRYAVRGPWSVKFGAQFLFTEYTTATKVQQFPQENDRFRNKSLLFCIGVGYKF